MDADDCQHLETWVEILATVVKELDPNAESPEELNADLIRQIESMKEIMIAVATGGPRIDTVNSDYRQRRGSVSDGLLQRGIEDPNLYQGTQKTRSEGHRRGRSEVR